MKQTKTITWQELPEEYKSGFVLELNRETGMRPKRIRWALNMWNPKMAVEGENYAVHEADRLVLCGWLNMLGR